MFNRRTFAVIKRELKTKLLSKTFIIMTLLIPLFMFGIFGIQMLIYSFSEEENPRLLFISESETINKNLKDELFKLPFVMNGNFSIKYETGDYEKLQERLKELKPSLLNEELTGVIFIPSSSLKDKKVNYYSTNPKNFTLYDKIKPSINRALIDIYFFDKELNEKDIEFASDKVDISGFRITKEEEAEEEGIGNMIALFVFTILLYMALIFAGQMTMNSVVEEKNSRIIEVLLSSLSSKELMTGKILGTTIIEVIQMAIWLSPLMLLISTTWFALPANINLNMDLYYIFFFLYNYFIALITFVGLYAAVGAIFDNPQDAQSGVWPLLMLIIIPFFIALSLQANPQSPVGKIASMVPFASLIVMPARMILSHVPAWQLILSMIINIAVMFFVFILAGKIYSVGILITGKKPKWSEVMRWVRAK